MEEDANEKLEKLLNENVPELEFLNFGKMKESSCLSTSKDIYSLKQRAIDCFSKMTEMKFYSLRYRISISEKCLNLLFKETLILEEVEYLETLWYLAYVLEIEFRLLVIENEELRQGLRKSVIFLSESKSFFENVRTYFLTAKLHLEEETQFYYEFSFILISIKNELKIKNYSIKPTTHEEVLAELLKITNENKFITSFINNFDRDAKLKLISDIPDNDDTINDRNDLENNISDCSTIDEVLNFINSDLNKNKVICKNPKIKKK